MNKTQAASKARKAKHAGAGRVRTFAKSVFDRLFLRSKIWEIRNEVRGLKTAMPELNQHLDLSVTLLSKKIDYLLAKIDVYADVDDKNHETLETRLGALDAQQHACEQAARSLYDALVSDMAQRHETLETRLGALDAQRHAYEQAARSREEEIVARFASIKEIVARRAEVETAFREEVRSRYDAMAARLTIIEMGNSALADKLEVIRLSEMAISQAVDGSSRNVLARIEAGQARLQAIETAQTDNVAKIEKSVEKTAFNEFRQREALDTLRQLLKFDIPLPATRGWAASPDFLLHLYQHIATHRPKVVVELGSGISTLVAAAALAVNGDGGRLYSLDHDEAYAQVTSKHLSRHDLTRIASVYHAPLGPWQPPRPTKLGKEWHWYSVPAVVNALDAIDLLIVDGPPEATGPLARYPAVPYFRSRLAPRGTILLDDARRPNEKATAEAWKREDALDLELLLRPDREFEKGLAILAVRNGAPPPR